MAKPLQRLFTPGSGATPPVLAGRKAEQEVLRQCLADLAAGVSPPHDVALIGPRDNHIDAALKAVASSESSRLAICEQLNALGYIWCPPNQPPPVTWQPGIPSLMAYVRQRAS